MSLSPDELKKVQQLCRESLGSTLHDVATNAGPINLKLENILLLATQTRPRNCTCPSHLPGKMRLSHFIILSQPGEIYHL